MRIGLGLALLLLGTAAAWAEIRVGITASGSGPGAALGGPQLKAVATLPKTIAGETVTYVAFDDESDATKAVVNARKLIVDNKVDVLLGSSLTPVSIPLIEIAAEHKVPLLTMAASSALVQPMDEKRKWVFKVVPNDDVMARAMLQYIAKTGAKTVGFIGLSDSYGEGYYKVLAELAPSLGITIVAKEGYARNDQSVTGQTLKLIAAKPDAVFIASAGTPAVLPHRSLRERGYTKPIYQTHGVATDEFIRLGGKEVEGAIFAGEAYTVSDDLAADDPFRKVTQAFIEAYRTNVGQPPVIFGAHVFDSMQLVERTLPAALKAGRPGTAEFRAALRDGIEGLREVHLNNGLASMSPTDHNGYDHRSAFIIKVEGGKFRLVK